MHAVVEAVNARAEVSVARAAMAQTTTLRAMAHAGGSNATAVAIRGR
jgi:hypothetical protein